MPTNVIQSALTDYSVVNALKAMLISTVDGKVRDTFEPRTLLDSLFFVVFDLDRAHLEMTTN